MAETGTSSSPLAILELDPRIRTSLVGAGLLTRLLRIVGADYYPPVPFRCFVEAGLRPARPVGKGLNGAEPFSFLSLVKGED
jgi:hypothetical protein